MSSSDDVPVCETGRPKSEESYFNSFDLLTRRMRWARHVARAGSMINPCKILVKRKETT
jgi:hypothetical protein